MDWIFNGIGTEIILFVIGCILGLVGYSSYIKKNKINKSKKAVTVRFKFKAMAH